MAVYFDPGWGEQLKNALSGIGTGIRDIINPNFEAQKKLQAALADPKIAQEYANMASVNPQLLSNPAIGGKNADFIRQLKPSQQFKNEQAIQGEVGTQLQNPGVRSDAARRQLKLNTANEDRIQNQQIDINDLKIQDVKQLNSWLEAHPDLKDDAMARQATGYTMTQLKEAKRQAQLIAEGEAMNPVEGRKLIEDSFSEGFNDYRKLEAFQAANPNAFKIIYDTLDWERKAKLDMQQFYMRLGASSRVSEEDRTYNSMDMNARSFANQYDVGYDTAIVLLGYDKLDPRFKRVTGEVSDEAVNQARVLVDQKRNAERSTAINRVTSALRTTISIIDKSDNPRKAVEQYASTLEENIANINAVTGRNYTVEIDETGLFGRGRKVVIKDEVGKDVAPESFAAPISVGSNGVGYRLPSAVESLGVEKLTDEELAKRQADYSALLSGTGGR